MISQQLLLHQQLKRRTLAAHQALEKCLVGRIKAVRSENDYIELLKVMYGYYAAMESNIGDYLASEPVDAFNGRRKANRILADLASGKNTDALPVCQDAPVITSYHSLLGAMYVLEGSTLGGQIIERMLRSQLDDSNKIGFSFFSGYGDKTQMMWESFKLNLLATFTDQETDEIIESAEKTFATFKHWLEKNAANEL